MFRKVINHITLHIYGQIETKTDVVLGDIDPDSDGGLYRSTLAKSYCGHPPHRAFLPFLPTSTKFPLFH